MVGEQATQGIAPGAYSRLQQEIVTVKARLDRQVHQLTRLNRVSDELLGVDASATMAKRFAEATVDVLDVALAAVWVFDDDAVQFAVCGPLQHALPWEEAGTVLASELRDAGVRHAIPLDPFWLDQLSGAKLLDPIVCPCFGQADEIEAVILAANTVDMAGMSEPLSAEAQEVVTLISQKLAAHIDAMAARGAVHEQMERVQHSEHRLALVLKGTNDGWWDWDIAGGTCFLSQRWRQMLGLRPTAEELDGFWLAWIHPDDRPGFETILNAALGSDTTSVEAELHLAHASGDYLPVLVRGTITRDDRGEPVRFTGSILDLSERKRQEQQVRRLAFYDPLTDLPNRRLLLSRLRETFEHNTRSRHIAAVLMLDLDRFKVLNDTHGHAAGDQMLQMAASRLQLLLGEPAIVARLSGDEFIVVLPDLGRDEEAALAAALRRAQEVREVFHSPFHLDVTTIHQSTTIGVALAVGGALTVDEILQRADLAMYAAKSAGRNAVRVFEMQMLTDAEQWSRFESRLRMAFQGGGLTMYYQPQVDATGVLRGVESLLRWIPQGGSAVRTDDIIMSAEDSGLIHELGLWVLQTACEQAAAWSAGPDCRIAVNLGATEFLHPDFPERVLSILRSTGVPGSAIRLEITEATVVSDLEFAADRMEMLRSHGIEFSLDDFGTGYSSLTYLRRLPLSEVKIDRSFVKDFPRDPQDAAIVSAVISLGSSLGLRVIAEGVETREQFDALTLAGCDIFQGFLVGTPQPPPKRLEELRLPLRHDV